MCRATPAAPLRASDDLVDCCRWVADADAAGDPQLAAVALAELYRHLTDRGWTAPPLARKLMQLKAAALDAELELLRLP